MSREKIRIAHSPDSDDAFMFYGLATDKIDPGPFEFEHVLKDIETLNQAALQGRYEVSAVSIHGYAYIADRYALLNSGASMGENYGPKVVSKHRLNSENLAGSNVAIPGIRTSAYLALNLFQPECKCVVVPFDQIMDLVSKGGVDAGVIIHEGQLVYREYGLREVMDLGRWWFSETGLPLPLGGNVIRRDLGLPKIHQISELIYKSIHFSLQHREEALNYALQFGEGIDPGQADRFVGMYVNDRTLDYGEEGRKAVRLFLGKGVKSGLIPHQVEVEFVGESVL
jgi:1,4-dihydroxy-6-naphthoate synthase